MEPLVTPRLRLVPATLELVQAEMTASASLAQALGAVVPDNWPPEDLADVLPLFLDRLQREPGHTGWYGWYGLLADIAPGKLVLGASGGFKGPPEDGEVEIGYAVLPQFQGRGYATEMVLAMTGWALAQPGVERVTAEVMAGNHASIRVLAKAGFQPAGEGEEPGSLRFVLVPEPAHLAKTCRHC
ncbi:MAG TPA: GNAT family N-acetyltransferase [Limnochorda sp.]